MRIFRKIMLLSLAALLLSLSACTSTPNMQTLLAYQKDGAVFSVTVTDGAVFHAEIALGTPDTLTLSGGDVDGIRFSFSESGTSLSLDGVTLPLPADSRLRASDWVALFHLSDTGVWKISRSRVGSTEVFVCATDGVTLYLDAETRLPLKIEAGSVTIDVTSARAF